jgi:hypothetical protein
LEKDARKAATKKKKEDQKRLYEDGVKRRRAKIEMEKRMGIHRNKPVFFFTMQAGAQVISEYAKTLNKNTNEIIIQQQK